MSARIRRPFDLAPHPEGGFYKETYRAAERVVGAGGRNRSAATSIHFLITPGSVSRIHRVAADEIWNFHLGGPMTVVELSGRGAVTTSLGSDVLGGVQQVQHVVKAGTWFGSFPDAGTAFTFVGCTVSPGFEFEDFELGSRAKLLEDFPDARELIIKLTEGLP
ncbi:RmlC-like cupin domain-containing protein [Pelagophyceae sp. CCMP2097]|nr:RmlC-like cupin domain-containing protein [Pelagophyceae sp. CCMP2097]